MIRLKRCEEDGHYGPINYDLNSNDDGTIKIRKYCGYCGLVFDKWVIPSDILNIYRYTVDDNEIVGELISCADSED